MRGARGYTLIELTVALAALVISLVASWSLLARSSLYGQALWDELCAQELATSALEQSLAEQRLETTPPKGRALSFSGPMAERLGTTLPDYSAVLHVREVPERPGMLECEAVVEWRRSVAAPGRARERLTAKLQRRTAP